MRYKIDECPHCGNEMYVNGPAPNGRLISVCRMCSVCKKPVKVDFARLDPVTKELVPLKKPFCEIGLNYYVEQQRMQRAKEKINKDFEEWTAKIRLIPDDYHTLTEDEWLEACRHFDGCAFCSSKDMSSRGFFIGFKQGGRYCNWNVVPTCEKCATAVRTRTNVFLAMHPRLGKRGQDKEVCREHVRNSGKRLEKILEYLTPRLEAAANEK